MTIREIATLLEQQPKDAHGYPPTGGEMLTCGCWGVLFAVCALLQTVEALLAR